MKQSNSPDPVERALQASGRRPAVPADRRARVRAAVHDAWQVQAASRPRPRLLVGLATAAAAALAVTVWLLSPPAPGPGRAGVIAAAGRTSLHQPGDEVAVGATLSTGAGDRLAVQLDSGHSLRLDHGTRLRIRGPLVLVLEAGAVYLDSQSWASEAPAAGHQEAGGAVPGVEVHTSLARIREIGTQFEVRLEGEMLQVRVREGKVAVASGEGSRQVSAGEGLRLARDGLAIRQAVSPEDPAWRWVGEVAPPLDLSGRHLLEFLTWSARERGLRLEFAAEDLAATAAGFELSGSIAGMTPDQALASVLLTCGMSHRIEDGRLIIQSQDPAAP